MYHGVDLGFETSWISLWDCCRITGSSSSISTNMTFSTVSSICFTTYSPIAIAPNKLSPAATKKAARSFQVTIFIRMASALTAYLICLLERSTSHANTVRGVIASSRADNSTKNSESRISFWQREMGSNCLTYSPM
eukprot:Gregarina_sp_Poly_1__10486@NODE_767_length_6374_cov_59_374822_g564_i0_p3_GENE_NODE_767_length_6374_cov_59_374822_g564_i0NODE_767_length_6374_cov_59_374822_g564_i0_p3_ORF_typecomplete_len136_score2_71_NODE_767_length_6374_cov_59_374822_g564_i027463153